MKRKRTVVMVVVIVVVFLLIGRSYALFNYSRVGPINRLIVGKLYMHYINNNSIMLSSVEPRNSLDSNQYIEFTIEGIN